MFLVLEVVGELSSNVQYLFSQMVKNGSWIMENSFPKGSVKIQWIICADQSVDIFVTSWYLVVVRGGPGHSSLWTVVVAEQSRKY